MCSSWFTGFHIEHIKTGDIRWQDIRRKLYPAERTAQRGRHSRYQSGFPHSRHIFNEHVSGTQQSGQQQIDRFVLSDNNGSDVVADILYHGKLVHGNPSKTIYFRRSGKPQDMRYTSSASSASI